MKRKRFICKKSDKLLEQNRADRLFGYITSKYKDLLDRTRELILQVQPLEVLTPESQIDRITNIHVNLAYNVADLVVLPVQDKLKQASKMRRKGKRVVRSKMVRAECTRGSVNFGDAAFTGQNDFDEYPTVKWLKFANEMVNIASDGTKEFSKHC